MRPAWHRRLHARSSRHVSGGLGRALLHRGVMCFKLHRVLWQIDVRRIVRVDRPPSPTSVERMRTNSRRLLGQHASRCRWGVWDRLRRLEIMTQIAPVLRRHVGTEHIEHFGEALAHSSYTVGRVPLRHFIPGVEVNWQSLEIDQALFTSSTRPTS